MLCDTEHSGIRVGEMVSYYYNSDKWSNLYYCQLGLSGFYLHAFKKIGIPYILHHGDCVVKYFIFSGSSGAIYRQWMNGSDYDDEIFMSIYFQF